MSKPRERWWPYVKNIIRAYPALKLEYDDLHTQSVTQRYDGIPGGGGAGRSTEMVALRGIDDPEWADYHAVSAAIIATERMAHAKDRLKIIDLVFWKQTHTLQGAAVAIPVGYTTAREYQQNFIYEVARARGLTKFQKVRLPEPK